MTIFTMMGHFPERYRFPKPDAHHTPWVSFVRGNCIREFVEQIQSRAGPYRRFLLLKDVRKRGRYQLRLVPAGGVRDDLHDTDDADYVAVVVRA